MNNAVPNTVLILNNNAPNVVETAGNVIKFNAYNAVVVSFWMKIKNVKTVLTFRIVSLAIMKEIVPFVKIRIIWRKIHARSVQIWLLIVVFVMINFAWVVKMDIIWGRKKIAKNAEKIVRVFWVNSWNRILKRLSKVYKI